MSLFIRLKEGEDMQQYVLVSYDISDQKRWRKVFKLMKGYGEHVQYSVFICQLTELQKAKLQASLEDIIHLKNDQVMFVHIGPVKDGQLSKKISTIGKEFVPLDLKRLIF